MFRAPEHASGDASIKNKSLRQKIPIFFPYMTYETPQLDGSLVQCIDWRATLKELWDHYTEARNC